MYVSYFAYYSCIDVCVNIGTVAQTASCLSPLFRCNKAVVVRHIRVQRYRRKGGLYTCVSLHLYIVHVIAAVRVMNDSKQLELLIIYCTITCLTV